jgi:hypothetical protein
MFYNFLSHSSKYRESSVIYVIMASFYIVFNIVTWSMMKMTIV